jgi:hypothetical protein
MVETVMQDALRALNSLVGNGTIASYAIAGSVAVSFHLEPHTTEELEVLVQFPAGEVGLPSQGKLHAAIATLGGSIEDERIRLGSWPIRMIAADTPFLREALETAPAVNLDGIPFHLLRLDYLCAMAVACGSTAPGRQYRHNRQIAMLIEHDAVDVSMVNSLLARHGFGSLAEEFLAWSEATSDRTPDRSPYWATITADEARMRKRNIQKPWAEKVASLERLREVAHAIKRSSRLTI